ncbi:MAG: hypothetical protein ACOX6O_04505 [Christensenellales bacterium]|jgi:hypothetical protein
MGLEKRKWALLLAIVIFAGTMFSANAADYYEASQDYYFEVDAFDNELVSDLLCNQQDRLAVATMVYAVAAYHIDEIRSTLENPDPMTKVYLTPLTSNPRFFRMYFFAPGETWVFTCNTIFGQIVGGPMNYTMVPGAAEMVLTSLQSEGTIGDYYPVDFYDILELLFELAEMP